MTLWRYVRRCTACRGVSVVYAAMPPASVPCRFCGAAVRLEVAA